MIKYAKIIDENTGLCEVSIGTNIEFYKSIGLQELDVIQSEIDEQWYLVEKLNTDEYKEKIAITLLEELKAKDNKNCKSRLTQGVLVDGTLYDMDTEAKSNILVILSQMNDFQTIDYIDYNYNPVKLSKTELANVLQTIILKTAEIYSKNAQNQMAESLTEQDIDYSDI